MKKKKKSPFIDSKVFVMTRPEKGEPYLSITTEEIAKEESKLTEIFNTVFFDYVLNLGNQLTIAQHKVLLAALTAPLSYQFVITHGNKANQIIETSLQELKTQGLEVDFLLNMPDEVSVLDYIIRHNLSVFLNDIKKLGLDQSLKKHQGFYQDLEQLFFSLPACFCFGIIDMIKLLTKKRKK